MSETQPRSGESPRSPEAALWRAVITQALTDATARPSLFTRQFEIDQTRDWFLTPNADFNLTCALAGLEPDAVRRFARERIEAGPAPRGTAGRGPDYVGINTLLEMDGETLPVRQWAERYDVPAARVAMRLRKGMALREALTVPKDYRADRYYEHNGESLTLQQWADRVGLNLETLRGRLTKGFSFEDALTKPVNMKRFKATNDAANVRQSEKEATKEETIEPGVCVNFEETSGTGGGSTAHDLPFPALQNSEKVTQCP